MATTSKNLYHQLMQEAQKEKINLANGNSRLLRKLYEEAGRDIANKARTAKGGFTKAWLKDYKKYINYRYKQLDSDLYKLTKEGMETAAQIASTVEGDFISYINNKYSLDIPKEDVEGMYHINQDMILRMISGKAYKDNLGVSKKIWTYSKGQKENINYIIARGLAEQRDLKQICDDLESYVRPSKKKDFNWNRIYPKVSKTATVDYNCLRLVRTSINHAFYNQNMANCKKNPFCEAVHWELSSQHGIRQVRRGGRDECDDYAEHEEGLGTGNFPKDNVPIPHPNCMCTQEAVISKSFDEIATELRNWIDGEYNPRLDNYFEKYA